MRHRHDTPTPPVEEGVPPPPHHELRLILLRALASSHARWHVCGNAYCKRTRLCQARDLACYSQPIRVDIARFLDWID